MKGFTKIYIAQAIVLGCFFSVSGSTASAAEKNMYSLPGEALQEDPYLPFAEVMPEPVGGIAAIYKKINYPEIARKAGIQGKVYVMVLVNENGGVDEVKIVKGIGGGCEEAAVDAIKKIKFTSAKNKGASVKAKLSLPIAFKL